MKRIFNYYKPKIGKVFLCFIIKVSGIVAELFIPIILSFILDKYVPNKDIWNIVLFGILMLICSLVGFLGNCKANQIAASLARDVTIELRSDLFKKIMSLDLDRIEEITYPSLVARISSDTYNIHQMTSMILRLGVRAPILLIGGTIATLFLDPILTLVMLGAIPFLALILYIISKVTIPLFNKVQLNIDEMVDDVRETMTGIKVIKALSKEDYEKERFTKINGNIFKYELKSGKTIAYLNPLVNVIFNFGLVLVLVIGAKRVMNGFTEPGKILAFTTYFTMILNAILAISRMITVISKAYASSLRIDYVFNVNNTIHYIDDKKTCKNYLEFDNVTFSYNKKRDNLHNISFALNKGETLGIVGLTGSGKSTLVNLLLRFYDPDQGDIYFNGKNLKSYNNVKLKRHIGVAMQYDCILNDSVKNNVNFYRHYDDDELKSSIDNAMASFIWDYNDKMDHELDIKGHNLSGGQKQRVILARSILGKPNLLIIDDGLSALDYATTKNFLRNLNTKYKNTTKIIISSRITDIENADKILVLKDGKAEAFGTKEEVKAISPIYRAMIDSMGGDNHDE